MSPAERGRDVGARAAATIGFWSSTLLAALAIVYLATLTVYFGTEGFAFPPSALVQDVAGVITFLTAPLMVVVFAAIRVVDYATQTALTMAGFVAWGPGLVALALLLAAHFRSEAGAQAEAA
jgi:hypothetical protein